MIYIWFLLFDYAGVPGSNLPLFFKTLSLSVTQILREDDFRTLRFIEYFNYLHDLPAISEDNEFFSVTSTNNSSSSRSNPSSRSTDVDMSHILPTEILYMLASYFEPRDCISLLRVNKIFNQSSY